MTVCSSCYQFMVCHGWEACGCVKRMKEVLAEAEARIKELIGWIRDNCGKSGSHSDERCLGCGRCPVTEILRGRS